VLAAGEIADGRGLAAALVLGAQGANLGTRVLASEEASAHAAWKWAIIEAESEDAVRLKEWGEFFPPTRSGAYEVVPRLIARPS
jgi:enoyl-[acyl-carrier protein] reductase II